MFKRIRELRIKQGMTCVKISEMLNISTRQYSRYEKGESRVPVRTIISLAKLYGVSVDYLMDLSDIPVPYT